MKLPSVGAFDAVDDREHDPLAGLEIAVVMGIHGHEDAVSGSQIVLHAGADGTLYRCRGCAPQGPVHKIILIVHDDQCTHPFTT